MVALPKSPSKLVDDGLVMGGCFIVHRPPSTDHFQLSRVDQVSYGAAGLFVLIVPPFPKESCFNLDVSAKGEMRLEIFWCIRKKLTFCFCSFGELQLCWSGYIGLQRF
jgi:hypothetical protein